MRILRSVEFNHHLAQFYCEEAKSGDAIVDDVLTELYDHRTGGLIAPDGVDVPIANAALFDTLFGEDQRRWINRYREKATKPFKNRLDRRCVFPVMILHFARQIKLCRTQERCSR